ncbi:MAG: hypothetical protein A4S09_08170 [Proteobacteria bacterium SG_bin7]|nr:MAG: hypothetical protein A4S09_08170 [Proteobacteria bacterium SG_bin7]
MPIRSRLSPFLLLIAVCFFDSSRPLWAVTCTELFQSTDDHKLTPYQSVLKEQAVHAGYEIVETGVVINGINRNIVIIGENHFTRQEQAKFGFDLLKSFDFWGYENGTHAANQLPALNWILNLYLQQRSQTKNKFSPELIEQSLGGSANDTAAKVFDLEYGLKMNLSHRLKYGPLRLLLLKLSAKLGPKKSGFEYQVELNEWLEDTSLMREQRMQENIINFLQTHDHAKKVAIVVGNKHARNLFFRLQRVSGN